jgi:hypothetical protein
MAVVTIDAKAELAQLQAEPDGLEVGAASDIAKASETKEAEAKPAEAAAKSEAEDPDDVEGEDGLTPRQKRDFSASMLKAIGKKHRMMKEAEEFAAAQYNERRMAEQRAQAVERELAELRAQRQPEPASAAATDTAARPERAKFATDQEFLDAMIAWGVEEGLKKRAQEEAQRAAERRQADILEAAKGRIAKALEVVPDFEAVTRAADIEVPPVVAGYMQKSPMFAELGYHLAKNQDVLKSLAKLEPDEQLVTIGKIESTLKPFVVAEPKAGAAKESDGATPSSKSASTNGQRSTTAPSEDTGTIPSRARDTAPVIRPLNGSGAAPAEIDPRDMNTRQMIDAWQRKHGANFSLRKRH